MKNRNFLVMLFKKKLTQLAAIIACISLSFTSCEKHDGINYLKSKCTAELNGQTYIDQQPYTYIFGPTYPTPFLEYSQYEATFETYLRTERGGKIVGAICNGASFMAKCGFLNAVKHTGNGLEQLKIWGSGNYINSEEYVNAQAVSDKNIVTANGSATLEFAKALLLLLENDTPERIEMYYQFYKQGFCTLFFNQ